VIDLELRERRATGEGTAIAGKTGPSRDGVCGFSPTSFA